MCGILALLNGREITPAIIKSFQKGVGRGPENSTIKLFLNNVIMGFHRLAINGQETKDDQPLNVSNCVLICNGEIYNFKYLYSLFETNKFSNNDCEIIIHLYKKFGIEETLNLIDGVFSFVLLDLEKKEIYIARDSVGVRPLYKVKKSSNFFYGFSSEMKMVADFKPDAIVPFQPGTLSKFKLEFISKLQTWLWTPVFQNKQYTQKFNGIDYTIENEEIAFQRISTALEKAVEKRVGATDRPVACLLSGGLDSSLICALVKKKYKGGVLETFSIGLENSEDLKYARIVADYLGTKHTEIKVSEKEFLGAIPETIKAIESYDTTTVRASVGNYLVSKYISKHSDAKVIFNGDGSDEVCGGYIYFHAAPDAISFDRECKRLLNDIHMFDVLRSDRSISSNGLEPRTPFLDKSFVQVYHSIPPHLRCHNLKKNCEKYLLRKSFDNSMLLPKEILFRKKEAFSDGVSGLKRSWFEIIQEFIKKSVPIQEMIKKPYNNLKFKTTNNLPAWNTPETDEQKYYRKIFHSFYEDYSTSIPYFWMPKFIKATDSSARTLNIYKKENEIKNKNEINNIDGTKKNQV